MRNLKFLAYALLVAAFSGCTGTGVNTANVFKPQGGTIDLNVSNLPDPSAYSSVEFQLDGKTLGKDTDVSDGWSYKLDSTSLTNGIHNVRAVGTTTGGEQVELLNNSIYIDNGAGAGTNTSASTAPSQTPASTDTGASPAADMGTGTAMGNGTTMGSQFRRR